MTQKYKLCLFGVARGGGSEAGPFYMYMNRFSMVINNVKVVLNTHVVHVGENTGTYTKLRFIVYTSLNISISVLWYVTPCRYAELQYRLRRNCCLHDGLTLWRLKIHPKFHHFVRLLIRYRLLGK